MPLVSRRWAVVVFFVITGAPVALLMYLSIDIAANSAVTEAERGESDSAQASAAFIHQRFQDVADQLDTFARRTVAPAMTAAPGGRPDMATLDSELTDLTGLQNGVNTAFVTDARGRLIAIAPARRELLGAYFTADDWYQGASTRDGPYVSGLSAAAAQRDLSSVTIAMPVQGVVSGEPSRLGYVVGLYSLMPVQRFVDDFAASHGTRLSVVDGAGMVLAAPGMVPGAVSSWPGGDDLLARALSGGAGVRNGRATISAYAPVPDFRWAVVADVPRGTALREAEQIRATVLSIAGVLGVVLVVCLVVGSGLIHRAQQAAGVQQRMEALARLNEAARSVHAEHGPRALQIIATSARGLVGAHFSALGVWDPAGGRMEALAHDAAPELSGSGLDQLAVLLVERCRPGSGTARGELADLGLATGEAELWELGPYLSVPLSAGDRVLGCLVACRREGSPPFHALNEQGLRQIAQHATSVLEKGRHDAEREAFLDRLSETNEELAQASRLKSQFLARMSHELRTPLSAILGFSDLLLEGASGELTRGQEEDVKEIASAGRVLLDVLNDILDLSRIEAGRMRLELRTVHLGELLSDVASALRPLARRKDLELRVAIVGGDPPVLADPLRIRQVVTNLVSNAVKFTQQGGVTVRLIAFPREV